MNQIAIDRVNLNVPLSVDVYKNESMRTLLPLNIVLEAIHYI
ncbi:MAG: hypothetical protein U0930_15250 [Pirellulales bacterium]